MSNGSDEHITTRDTVMNEPIGCRELYTLKMTKELAINLFALSILAFFIFGYAFLHVYALFTGKNVIHFSYTSLEGLIMDVLAGVFLLCGTLVLHELIHGLSVSIYGGKPHYGMGRASVIFPYFYSTTKTIMLRNQSIVILLAPLVMISFAGILFMVIFPKTAHWILLPLIVNAAGSVGDLWMTFILLRYPKNVSVEDHADGITIYGQP